ncbi:MAG: phosphoribosylglycinamide formyltransferase [candidate division Zixibacteria bacterium]|nr:phosphoribosylglycinamide formyltransferase [candidate division Zixibacteria bacterium]
MSPRARIAVFISGRGTGLQALIDAARSGVLSAEIVLVVSSNPEAYGLERAKDNGIPSLVHNAKQFASPEIAAESLFGELRKHNVEYIALSGYLRLLPLLVLRAYPNRVVNIHPALLPKYGGKGFYGHHVHEAVIAAHDRESGVTVHLVDEIYDHGQILEQVRVPVLPDDTPDTLAARILIEEHKLYPQALEKLIQRKYRLNNE